MMSVNCKRGIESCKPPDCKIYEVKIQNVGTVQGEKRVTMYHETYYAFEGIPYGYVPIDSLRYKAPLEAEPWKYKRPCLKPGPAPAQIHEFSEIPFGNENCLTLNIYVKQIHKPARYPVMVFIYGGGYTEGDAKTYQPDYFMFEDTVLVTVNYRVGIFGFLSFEDFELEVPGNAGLKDVVLALKWIQKNIGNFNGDSRKVCMFGCSAGAGLTHILSASPKAKGLFQKMIIQSGSMLCQWSHVPRSNYAYRMAVKFGYTGPDDERHLLAFFRLMPAMALANWHLLTMNEFCQGLLYAFGPTIEAFEMEHAIITQPYVKMLRNSWGNHIPMIIGFTSFEGIYLHRYRDIMNAFIQKSLQELVIPFLVPPEVQQRDPSQVVKHRKKMIEAYFGTQADIDDNYMKFLDFMSYRLIVHGVHRAVKSRYQFARKATYQYRFDFDSLEFNLARYAAASIEIPDGVSHADDLFYLFRYANSYKLSCDSPEYKTIRLMVGMWVAFANTSNPNTYLNSSACPVCCDDEKPPVWKNICQSSVYHAFNISYTNQHIRLPEEAKLRVWNSLYEHGLF